VHEEIAGCKEQLENKERALTELGFFFRIIFKVGPRRCYHSQVWVLLLFKHHLCYFYMN